MLFVFVLGDGDGPARVGGDLDVAVVHNGVAVVMR